MASVASHLARFTCVLLSLLSAAPLAAAPDERVEPPLQFLLELDGVAREVRVDAPFTLPPAPQGAQAVLRIRPHREFRHGGMSFRYPRHLAFEADFESPGLKLWVLSGNDAVVLVVRYPTKGQYQMQGQLYVDELLETYSEQEVQTSAVQLQLAGRSIPGRRVEVDIIGESLRQDVFALAGSQGDMVLVFQDTPDGTQPSAEARQILELFRASFEP